MMPDRVQDIGRSDPELFLRQPGAKFAVQQFRFRPADRADLDPPPARLPQELRPVETPGAIVQKRGQRSMLLTDVVPGGQLERDPLGAQRMPEPFGVKGLLQQFDYLFSTWHKKTAKTTALAR